MKSFFITATDTDAGKTFISSGLLQHWSAQGFKTLGFKPVASGCMLTSEGLRNDDALQLIETSTVKLDYSIINPYAFEPAIAPHIAVKVAKESPIDLQKIVTSILEHQQGADYVIVEGVGGWLVPLNDQQSIEDLATLLNFPVILVVNLRLGCINQALLTAQAIEQKGLKLAGWVANTAEESVMSHRDENIQSLKLRLKAPLLGVLPYLSDENSEKAESFSKCLNWDMCN